MTRGIRVVAAVSAMAVLLGGGGSVPAAALEATPSPQRHTVQQRAVQQRAVQHFGGTASITVSGILRVRLVDGARTVDEPTTVVLLDTADGTIELDARTLGAARTGDRFSGTVLVPVPVGVNPVAAAVDASQPLRVVESSLRSSPTKRSLNYGVHEVYVAVVRPTKFDCTLSDCGIADASIGDGVVTADEYWLGQSDGQVHLVQQDANGADAGAVVRTNVSGGCGGASDIERMWDKAASEVVSSLGWTGKPSGASDTWYFGDGGEAPKKRHLVVLTPFEAGAGTNGADRAACSPDRFLGIASFGAAVHSGGVAHDGVGVESSTGLSTSCTSSATTSRCSTPTRCSASRPARSTST